MSVVVVVVFSLQHYSELRSLPLVQTLRHALSSWRADHASFPVLPWAKFVHKTRTLVNPLVTDDLVTKIASTLHALGEVSASGRMAVVWEVMGGWHAPPPLPFPLERVAVKSVFR